MKSLSQVLALPFRILLTAYCFLQFAVQVIWLGKWRMPRIIKHDGDPVAQRHEALYSAHQHVTFYLKTLSFFRLVEFKTIGRPAAKPGIVIANHPSLLDFIVFLRDYPHAICMYKPQSLNNPVLSSFVQIAGYIAGMRGEKGENKRIITDCGIRLNEGHNVVIFPEGSRSPGATSLHKFRSTAFHAAIKNDAPIQPVAILCQPLFLGKGQRWVAFSKNKNTMTIQYLPPIHIKDLDEEKQSSAGLAEATKTAIETALADM